MIRKGILFGEKHSYHDLNLVLTEVKIPSPTPKTTYVDVPGRDAPLDLSEALGEITYDNRDCKFVFVVHPKENMIFEQKLTQLSNALNGRKMKIVLDDDSGYYYYGRLKIEEYKRNGHYKQIVISAYTEPYKLKHNPTEAVFTLSSTRREISLTNDRMSVIPEITCTGTTNIVFDGNSYALGAGTHIVPDILLKEGQNSLTISGSGRVTFKYQEGAL